LLQGKFANGGSADFGKVRATAKLLAHFVGERADVGAGRAFNNETGYVARDLRQAVFEEFDFNGLELDGLIFAGEFVGGASVNFFGGESRRHLLEDANAIARKFFEKRAIESRGWSVWTLCLSLGVVGVGGETETKASGVAFAAAGIKLDEAGSFTKQENKYAGGERIESAEMANLAEAGEMPDGVDNVVGSLALGLVNDESTVKRCWLWFARHF